jgi:hypothetical protein
VTAATSFHEPSTPALDAAGRAIVPHLRATPTPATVQGATRDVVTAAVDAVDLSWLVGIHLPEGTPDVAATALAIEAAVRRALLGEEDPEARRAAVDAVHRAAMDEARRLDAIDAENESQEI